MWLLSTILLLKEEEVLHCDGVVLPLRMRERREGETGREGGGEGEGKGRGGGKEGESRVGGPHWCIADIHCTPNLHCIRQERKVTCWKEVATVDALQRSTT